MLVRDLAALGVAAVALIGAAPAERAAAQFVSFTMNGTLDTVVAGSPLATDPGLALGDPFGVMALIDESFLNALVGVGPESVPLDTGGNSFLLDIANGAITLDQTAPPALAPTQALFDNGLFIGFDFLTDPILILTDPILIGGNSFQVSLFENQLQIVNDLGEVEVEGFGTSIEISPE
jgi:hypothetical protein